MSLEVAIRATVGAFPLDVSFETPGGIVALFGPSGAGKTLTLRAIAGLTRPDSGRIVLNGRTVFDGGAAIDLQPRQRRIGYVFQQYALFPHLDVAANVRFGVQGLPREERAARTEELLQLVGLPGHGSRSVRGLSGGEQQRIALARALAPRPELILLDEPFAALDGPVRRRLREELRSIHRATGVPMVLVTHNLADVRQLADSLVLLDGGRVLCAGPTTRILADPGSAVAAELLRQED